jgi:hypothetical protein
MGVFDSFYTKDGREVQLKAGDCCLDNYEVGDPCDILDGVYHALDKDVVVIRSGMVVDVGDAEEVLLRVDASGLPHFDKWGGRYA